MDFPAFSSICSSYIAECGVNAGWISVVFCSSCRFVRGILCRWEDEGSKRQRDEESKRQREEGSKSPRDKKTKRQSDEGRDKETKGLRVKETKGQRVKETKGRRVKETKSQRDKGTRRRKPRHLLFTSYSPPIRVLFTASSPPNSFKSIQFVSKNIREIRVSKQHTKEHRFVRGR